MSQAFIQFIQFKLYDMQIKINTFYFCFFFLKKLLYYLLIFMKKKLSLFFILFRLIFIRSYNKKLIVFSSYFIFYFYYFILLLPLKGFFKFIILFKFGNYYHCKFLSRKKRAEYLIRNRQMLFFITIYLSFLCFGTLK